MNGIFPMLRQGGHLAGLATCVAFLLLLSATTAPAQMQRKFASADSQQTEQFIADLGATAITVLRQPNLTLNQRETQFHRLLQSKFDLDFIGRFVLGKYWRQATPEQQEEYRELFDQFVLKTYAARLGGYAGQQFHVANVYSGGKQDILVRSVITGGSGQPLTADWRVRNIDGTLKIIDVSVEGISMSITQRQEFAAVIARQGIAGLLRQLRARVERLPAERIG